MKHNRLRSFWFTLDEGGHSCGHQSPTPHQRAHPGSLIRQPSLMEEICSLLGSFLQLFSRVKLSLVRKPELYSSTRIDTIYPSLKTHKQNLPLCQQGSQVTTGNSLNFFWDSAKLILLQSPSSFSKKR